MDIILVHDCMAHGMIAEYVNREQSTLRRYQTCRRQATNKTRKERLKNYANMTIYAICQARANNMPPQTSYNYCHLTNRYSTSPLQTVKFMRV